MTDLSPAQKKYLTHIRHEKYPIRISRIFLFLGFLLLWEISAREEWIDSFIFSSPSAIGQTFLPHDTGDRSLFAHIGITLMETLYKLCICGITWNRHRCSSVGMSKAVKSTGTLSRRPEQSAQIRSRTTSDCLARCECPNHHCFRNVCGTFRFCDRSLHRISWGGSGKVKAYPHAWRHKKRRTDKNCPSVFCASYFKYHESKYRVMPCRCGHR